MKRFSLKTLYRWALSALSETAVAVPWMILFYAMSGEERWPEALPGAWLLLAAYLGAALWEFGAPESQRGSGNGRLWALAAGVGAIYLVAFYTTPPELRGAPSPLKMNLAMALLPVAGYLWYQGAARAAEGLEYGRVFARFGGQSLGMVAALIFLMLLGAAGDPRVQVFLYWSLFLLFGSGLTLLVITRERALRADQARLGESGAGGEHMSPLLTWVVGGLMALTLVASYLLSTDRLLVALALLKSPFEWLIDVAMLVVIRWAMIAMWILGFFLKPRKPPKPQEGPEDQGGEAEMPLPPVTDEGLAAEPVDWIPYLKIAVMIIGAITLAVALLRLRRNKAGQEGDQDEERISLGFWQGLMEDLRGLWSGTPGGAPAGAGEPLTDDPRDPRALFRRLQAWGLAIGRPRGPAETPQRFARALSERSPRSEAAASRVTAVYQQARYGSAQPSDEAVAEAAESLKKLQGEQE